MIPIIPSDTANGMTADVPAICHIPDVPVTQTGKRIVLLIALLAGFIIPFDGSAVNIALPAMGTEFHMDAISFSWIATACLLARRVTLSPSIALTCSRTPMQMIPWITRDFFWRVMSG